jgi:adenylosuccinate synthase
MDLYNQLEKINIDELYDFYRTLCEKSFNILFHYEYSHILEENSVFEGAQGVLLHPEYGFYPYVTKTDTTTANAKSILDFFKVPEEEVEVCGVIRAFMTRHGRGPFPTLLNTMDSTIKQLLDGEHNGRNIWQGVFKVGNLDLILLKYSLAVVGKVDYLALTCLDRMKGSRSVCNEYQLTDRWVLEGHGKEEAINKFFDFARKDGLFSITGIKVIKGMTEEDHKQRNDILNNVRPICERSFSWNADISKSRTLAQLPDDAQRFIDYIEENLGVRVRIISVGPTCEDKFEK